MTDHDQSSTAWLRLSDACQQLRRVGVGDADLLRTIAYAGLRERIVATGFQSVHVGGEHHAAVDRAPVRSMMWRVLCSPKADDAGYERWIRNEALIWTRGDHVDNFTQEIWRCVFVDRLSFDALLTDTLAAIGANIVNEAEVLAWIEVYPGTGREDGWEAFQTHFGARACKRHVFRSAWSVDRGVRGRGRPRKIAEISEIDHSLVENLGFLPPA